MSRPAVGCLFCAHIWERLQFRLSRPTALTGYFSLLLSVPEKSMRMEHVVPFLDMSAVLYLYGRCCHSFQAALPPSDLGAEAAWLHFKSLSQALGQLTLWKSEGGQQVGDVQCRDVKVHVLGHCTWAVSSAHLWLWCGYFAASFKSSLVSPFQAPVVLQCSSSPSLCAQSHLLTFPEHDLSRSCIFIYSFYVLKSNLLHCAGGIKSR